LDELSSHGIQPRNAAWAGYGGGTLYTRSKTISPEVLERVREATAKAKVPYDKYWKADGMMGPLGSWEELMEVMSMVNRLFHNQNILFCSHHGGDV